MCNPPYTILDAFLLKALIEFYRGKDVVLVIPEYALNSKIFKDHVERWADASDRDFITFDTFDKPLPYRIAKVTFL